VQVYLRKFSSEIPSECRTVGLGLFCVDDWQADGVRSLGKRALCGSFCIAKIKHALLCNVNQRIPRDECGLLSHILCSLTPPIFL